MFQLHLKRMEQIEMFIRVLGQMWTLIRVQVTQVYGTH